MEKVTQFINKPICLLKAGEVCSFLLSSSRFFPTGYKTFYVKLCNYVFFFPSRGRVCRLLPEQPAWPVFLNASVSDSALVSAQSQHGVQCPLSSQSRPDPQDCGESGFHPPHLCHDMLQLKL